MKMKNDWRIVIIAEKGIWRDDYVKTVKCKKTGLCEALNEAERVMADLERTYRHVYIADVYKESNYTDPPMGM